MAYWEYQISRTKWVQYDDEINNFLNEHSTDECVNYVIQQWKVIFNMKEMRQINEDSAFVRQIRCSVKNESDQKIVWEYMIDKGRRWVSFPPKICSSLEKQSSSRSTDDPIKADLFGSEVSIDLSTETMKFDDDLAKELKVRRVESDALPPSSTQLPVPNRSPIELRKRELTMRNDEASNKKATGNSRAKSSKIQKGGKKKRRLNDDDEEIDAINNVKLQDESDDEGNQANSKKHKTKTQKGKKKRKLSIDSSDENEEANPNPNTDEISKVQAEVDFECHQLIGKAGVYVNEQGIIYSAMLNQTNIQFNNNKFYMLQILKEDVKQNYFVWFRWGRVGFTGQTKLTDCGDDINKAIGMFHEKFYDKTRNIFVEGKFEKVAGKYDLIKMDISLPQKAIPKNDPKEEKSMLDERVQKVISLICNFDLMERQAKKLHYDSNKIPLGKLTKEQIKAGHEALSQIEEHIKAQKFDRDFLAAVNSYYTRIPHSFGMRVPSAIKTIDELKMEIELLDVLAGIQVAISEAKRNQIDKNYALLKWDLVPLEEGNVNLELIRSYMENTHGQTHNRYKMVIKNVYELAQKADRTQYEFLEEIGNRKLLWHGSRITNFYGILSHGLKIAPPEAPITGYMFGKGVYFADASSKSANYSLSDPNQPGLMLLSEVALGNMHKMTHADDKIHKNLPSEKNSVLGIGRWSPNPGTVKIMDDAIEVPFGELTEEVKCEGALIYNEYIVYDTRQIRERFLVEFDFKFEFDL